MKIQKKVASFEKRMNWSKTPSSKIIRFIRNDVAELNGKKLNHKILDVFFEIIQLANRKGINLEKEIKNHMKNTEGKYLKQKPK